MTCKGCGAPGDGVTCTPCNRPVDYCVCPPYPGDTVYLEEVQIAANGGLSYSAVYQEEFAVVPEEEDPPVRE